MTQRAGGGKKIRLLHLLNGLVVGGAEVMVLQYIRALGTEDYDHFVYFFGADGPIRKRIEELGVPLHAGKKRASIKQPIRFASSIHSLMRDLLTFVIRTRIQVIQSHLGHANQLAVAISKLSGVPAFPTVHSTKPFIDKRSLYDPRVYFVKAVNWFTYHMADRVVAVSGEVKQVMHKTYGLADSRVVVLNNGIVFDNSLSEPVNLEKESSSSANEFKVVAVGRLVSSKGFDILVRATAEAVNQGLKNLLVRIAGEGEERSRLETLINRLGMENHVRLLGLRHDVLGLMKACDIFVIPSFYEGLSIAMIEAMACGLPIIASNSSGLAAHIRNRQNGLLFPVKDHKALAECIVKLSNDKQLRATVSRGARESFVRKYDMHRNIKPLDMLFRRYATLQ